MIGQHFILRARGQYYAGYTVNGTRTDYWGDRADAMIFRQQEIERARQEIQKYTSEPLTIEQVEGARIRFWEG